MPEYKKQHYVPKFYLRKFTNNDRLINLFNIDTESAVHGASLKHQCYKEYFYDKDGTMENMFQLIERDFSKLINTI
ncbi:MAG: DUF4238 domain-containing protein, partial [Verrucomicrobiota bacterium]